MQIGTTYNFLVWDSPELPFPKESLHLLNGVNLSEILWNTSGLPEDGAKYSITNNILYREEKADGKIDVERQDFTGEFIVGCLLLSKVTEESSYMITFSVTAFKGEIKEIILANKKRLETSDYIKYVADFTKKVKKAAETSQKWWYRWLYIPYHISVRVVATIICAILLLINKLITKIAFWLTPL
jgi:hypothetical protein